MRVPAISKKTREQGFAMVEGTLVPGDHRASLVWPLFEGNAVFPVSLEHPDWPERCDSLFLPTPSPRRSLLLQTCESGEKFVSADPKSGGQYVVESLRSGNDGVVRRAAGCS